MVKNTSVIILYETNLTEKRFECIHNDTALVIKYWNETDSLNRNNDDKIVCGGLLPSHHYLISLDYDNPDCTSLSEPVKTGKIYVS